MTVLRNLNLFTVFLFLCLIQGEALAQRFFVQKSTLKFVSDAPLERIEAVSNAMKGVIDIDKRTFAFSVALRSFKGFNGILQQEHFHENYVESEKYPISTFTGKIVDDFNPSVLGKYQVRVKGNFTIRGITQEKILKGIIEVRPNAIILNSEFNVVLDDYSIHIPRVVYQKIAPEVIVTLFAEMNQNNK